MRRDKRSKQGKKGRTGSEKMRLPPLRAKRYISVCEQLVIMYLHKEELGMEEGKHMSV